jgi:hypothetical protein
MGDVRHLESGCAPKDFSGPLARNGRELRRAIDPVVAVVFEVDVQDLRAAPRRSPRAALPVRSPCISPM